MAAGAASHTISGSGAVLEGPVRRLMLYERTLEQLPLSPGGVN